MVSLFPDTSKGERNEEGPKAVGPPAVYSEARYHTLLKPDTEVLELIWCCVLQLSIVPDAPAVAEV